GRRQGRGGRGGPDVQAPRLSLAHHLVLRLRDGPGGLEVDVEALPVAEDEVHLRELPQEALPHGGVQALCALNRALREGADPHGLEDRLASPVARPPGPEADPWTGCVLPTVQ